MYLYVIPNRFQEKCEGAVKQADRPTGAQKIAPRGNPEVPRGAQEASKIDPKIDPKIHPKSSRIRDSQSAVLTGYQDEKDESSW